MPRTRYIVKCRSCDQTFWLARKDDPLPEHGSWNRRLDATPPVNPGCPGEGKAGHWIGEDRVDPPP